MMKTQSYEKGLAMVEFTILLPIFLLLLLGMTELGRAFYTYAEIEKRSRDSARYLSSTIIEGDAGGYELTQEDIDKISNLAVYGSINGGTKALVPSLATEHVTVTLNNDYIQVEIVYPFQPVLSQLPNFFNGDAISLNFNMTSSYSMRVLL